MNPMKQIVGAVLRESAPGGASYRYFEREAHWEGPMRARFAELVGAMFRDDQDASRQAEERLRFLNGKYGTRYPVDGIPTVAQTIWAKLGIRGWSQTHPTELFLCSNDEAELLAELPPAILHEAAQAGLRRPYSLATKYLHFCFPKSFPIYDSRAAASIQMWSFVAFEDRGPEWQPFQSARMADSSGGGYRAVVTFYRQFWAATSEDQRVELSRLARDMGQTIGGEVSVLDLVDKLLWTAAGDPLPLGLRRVYLDGSVAASAPPM